jgi:hypothetical protein
MKPALDKYPVWRTPILVNAVCTFGLLAALVSDMPGDLVSWLALAVPVVVCVRYAARAKNGTQSR